MEANHLNFMPCLIKDRTGRSPYWYCAYTAPDGHRLKKSTRQTDRKAAWEVCLAMVNAEGLVATKSATEAQLRKVINSALERIGERKLNDLSIQQALDDWIASKRGSVSEASISAYKYARDAFVKFLGRRSGTSIRTLSKGLVVEFRDHLLAEGRTPGRVNTIKKYLNAPFEAAKREGLIDYNPFAAVDGLKSGLVAKDTFSPGQVSQLLKAAQGTDWEGMILVGYTTGMRLQDAANLAWSATDLENGVISFVERKGNKRVVLGLHEDLADWIMSRPAPDDPHAPLFPTLANRPGAGRTSLSTEFMGIMATAGISGRLLRERKAGAKAGNVVWSLGFHSFRHGAATAVFTNAALKDITRRVTAHSARGVVDRYIHEDIVAIREATKLIPRLPKP